MTNAAWPATTCCVRASGSARTFSDLALETKDLAEDGVIDPSLAARPTESRNLLREAVTRLQLVHLGTPSKPPTPTRMLFSRTGLLSVGTETAVGTRSMRDVRNRWPRSVRRWLPF